MMQRPEVSWEPWGDLVSQGQTGFCISAQLQCWVKLGGGMGLGLSQAVPFSSQHQTRVLLVLGQE